MRFSGPRKLIVVSRHSPIGTFLALFLAGGFTGDELNHTGPSVLLLRVPPFWSHLFGGSPQTRHAQISRVLLKDLRPYGCQYARAHFPSYQNEYQRKSERGAWEVVLSDLGRAEFQESRFDGVLQLVWRLGAQWQCGSHGRITPMNKRRESLDVRCQLRPSTFCLAGDFWRSRDNWNQALLATWVWVEIKPPGIGPHISAQVSIYQGSMLGTSFWPTVTWGSLSFGVMWKCNKLLGGWCPYIRSRTWQTQPAWSH